MLGDRGVLLSEIMAFEEHVSLGIDGTETLIAKEERRPKRAGEK